MSGNQFLGKYIILKITNILSQQSIIERDNVCRHQDKSNYEKAAVFYRKSNSNLKVHYLGRMVRHQSSIESDVIGCFDTSEVSLLLHFISYGYAHKRRLVIA